MLYITNPPTYLPTYLPRWTFYIYILRCCLPTYLDDITEGWDLTTRHQPHRWTFYDELSLSCLAINSLNHFSFSHTWQVQTIKLFLKNVPCPASFSFIFVFSNNTFFTTNKSVKCPSSLRCWDSNPQPSEWKSPPITTGPGLPPSNYKTCCC